MNADVETYIRQNYGWSKLPLNIKQVLGNSQKDYDKWVVQFSVKNQLRFRGNIVRLVKKDEKGYYEELLKYSRDHLMLYPYHLSDFIVTGMRITPFQYYISIMQDLLDQERSYDSLPNFTAADCLRLLGIGRNQYIDLMNHCRSSKKFFGVRKKPVRDLLPSKPVDSVPIEPWWLVQVGYVTEDDIRLVSKEEKKIIDKIIDDGAQRAGEMVLKDVKALYSKGLVYLDVPVEDNDCFIVPPLEGFVMNRVLGDYFENLLYQIFVSIDEHTTVAELANVLQTDLQLIKNVVSMYCRLGFARKKGVDNNDDKYHPSWKVTQNLLQRTRSKEMEDFFSFLTESEGVIIEGGTPVTTPVATPSATEAPVSMSDLLTSVTTHTKRTGFLFDSTLTAFLMMGNLSSGLKSHAVTMFEVGKLSDESLDSFLMELEKVGDVGEGEAQRYFHHALTLRSTILFLRHNAQMLTSQPDAQEESVSVGPALDLIRCESLQNLDSDVCSRLLNKNYSLLVSMAPLTNEIRPVTSCKPPHLGPAIPEVNSVWFKLFIYTLTKMGPPSLLLSKGTRLRVLPKIFRSHERLLITPWGHDPGNVPAANALITLNDALCHSAVLIQGQGSGGDLAYVPFPLDENSAEEAAMDNLRNHEAVQKVSGFIDLQHTCGYITMMRLGTPAPVPAIATANCATTTHSTPMACSSPTSPVNGIKDHISKELLASELDKLAQEEEEGQGQSQGQSQGQTEECTPVAATQGSKCEGNNWVLLDCSFGIPLFDADLNAEVCQRVVKFKLCQSHSLKELTQSSRKMVLQLLDFISNHQSGCENDRSSKRFVFPSKKGDHEMPLPTRNLLYSDGQLSLWDGS